jgi:hypothetical protein
MKKEVYSNSSSWLFLIILLVLFTSVFVPFVVALGQPIEGSDAVIEYGSTEPQRVNPVLGYWLACVGSTEPGNCNVWIPQNTDLDESVIWPAEGEGGYPEFPNGAPPYNDEHRSFGSDPALGLNLKYLYTHETSDWDKFGFSDALSDWADVDPANVGEIQKVKFVLEPMTFTSAGSPLLWGSHGGYGENFANLISNYESDKTWFIKDCMGTPLESLGLCQFEERDFDVSAVELDVLRHNDCGAFADLNPEFCEGVVGVGANAVGTYPDGINANLLEHAGKGGCYVEAYGETPGRDWFWNEQTTLAAAAEYKRLYQDIDKLPPFSSRFHGDEEKIGGCCGNDDEDFGAIVGKDNSEFLNRFICVNTSVGSLWLESKSINSVFRIFPITRPVDGETVSFDAVSNYASWFVCDSSDKISDLYDLTEADDDYVWVRGSGPALSRYQVLPNMEQDIQIGVTEEEGGQDDGDYSGIDNDNGEAGGEAREDLIDQEHFEEGLGSPSGPFAVTDCDKDGDGYDGYWTVDPSAPSRTEGDWRDQGSGPWKEEDGQLTCNPRAPYDCDDNNRAISPGLIDYCDGYDTAVNTEDNDCNTELLCIPRVDGSTPGEIGDASINSEFFIPRYMCHDIDGYGGIAECCSWDLAYCMNNMKGRREGSAINTLNEFTTRHGQANPSESTAALVNKSNMVLRYGVSTPPGDPEDIDEGDTYRLNLHYLDFDEKIQNFSDYKSLEFEIYLTANFEVEIWIGFLNPGAVGDPDAARSNRNYIYPFKARVLDYIVGEPRLGKWLHVIIPVEDIYGAMPFNVENIVFASDVQRLYDLGTTVRATIGECSNCVFSNVIGLDKIMLRPEKDLFEPSDENYYCSGTWPPVWVSDLDDTSKIGPANEQAGKAACNAIPSYRWTGGYCCGDDTGNNVDSDTRGQEAFKEFFNDTLGGCWAGRFMANNERVMVVEYRRSPDLEKTVQVSCSNYTCTYDLPPRPGIIVENPNPEVYDLAFVDGGYTPIGVGGVSPDDNSMLRAEDVPLQIQYVDGEFYACNGADFIFDLDNTNTGEKLIIDDDEHKFGNCEIKGIYFCDHADGKDHGWDSEPLSVYVGTNMTMSDGTSIRPEGGDTVAATYRNETKHNYNLVRNGGFESI